MKFKSEIGRRDFIKNLGAVGALHALSPYEKLLMNLRADSKRLSWKAFRGTTFEGNWQPAEIEGRIPAQLQGSL